MKRFITYITLISCLMMCLPSFAAGFTPGEVRLLQEAQGDIINQYISISGTTEEELYNSILTVGIIEEDLDKSKAGNYQVVKQLSVGSAGSYSIKIPFQSGGSYIVRIGSENSDTAFETTLSTASVDTINNFMYGIKNEYDKEMLNSELLSKGEDLGFDLTIYKRLSQEKQEAICDAVLSDASDSSMEEIKSMLSDKCSYMAISNQGDTNIILDTLTHYNSDYSFGSDAEYIAFSDGGSALRSYVAQNLGKTAHSSRTDVKKTLYKYTVLYNLYSGVEVESQMINKINTYSSYINDYSVFNAMELGKKTNIAGYLYSNKAVSLEDFNSKLNYAIVNYNTLFGSSGESFTPSPGNSSPTSSTVSLPSSPQQSVQGSTSTAVTVSFDDLEEAKWAEEAIMYLLESNVVNGKSVGKFYPNDNVTRAEFVKMLMLGCNVTKDNAKNKSFYDVPSSHWAYEYVSIASSRGLVNGISENEFGADNYITREDMATLGYRILTYFGDVTGGQSLENSFIDSSSFSDYAKNGIIMLNNHGYINGYPDGSFKPKNNVTRAEAAQFIYNLIKERG